MPATFEEYWDTVGSRQDIADHKERARDAWNAGIKSIADHFKNRFMGELITHDVPPYLNHEKD